MAALRRGYENGQAQLLQLEQQGSALRETLLRIRGAIQILEELLVNQEPRDQHQPDTATFQEP